MATIQPKNSDQPEICLGVTGSIAAYKVCELARLLVKSGCGVTVVMTRNATEFIRPLTFETITGRPVITGMFERADQFDTAHVSLAHRSAAIVIAPATANVIGKIAQGIADDFLTTTVLAAECTVVLAPAMNQSMVLNAVYRENVATLRHRGCMFIEGTSGELACGETGAGRMAEPSEIAAIVGEVVACSQSLARERVLVTAGPTREYIDPVRFISNPSSGKMGYEIARAARRRGATVTLVSGPTTLAEPFGIECIHVTTADEMARAVRDRASECTIVVATAAVADYTPAAPSEQKLKKTGETMQIELKRTEDILEYVANQRQPGRIVVGFAAETDRVVENAREKLCDKGLDLIVANTVGGPAGGFASDENAVTLLYRNGRPDEDIPLASKRLLASTIMDRLASLRDSARLSEEPE